MTTRHYKIVRLPLASGQDAADVVARLKSLAQQPLVEALDELRLIGDGPDAVIVMLSSGDPNALPRAWSQLQAWADALGPTADASSNGGPTLFVAQRHGPAAWHDFATLDPVRGVAKFAAAVAESGLVWGLYGDTWARSQAVPDNEALPFWPTADLAATCIAGPWLDCVPRPVKLETLVQQWLPSMEEDRIAVVLVPTPSHAGLVVSAPELAAALAK